MFPFPKHQGSMDCKELEGNTGGVVVYQILSSYGSTMDYKRCNYVNEAPIDTELKSCNFHCGCASQCSWFNVLASDERKEFGTGVQKICEITVTLHNATEK